MSEPLISIVMPVYNTAQFLARSIESVLVQTYKNLEIVIVDDASTDNSWEIIQKYALKDQRIKAQTIPFVDGPKVTRDCAIRRATGDWIIPIDSDDTIEPDYVKKIWNRHVETGADFIGTKMVLVDENCVKLGSTIPSAEFDYSVVYSGTEAMLRILSYWQFGANGAMWNRSVMTNVCPEGTKYDYADEFDTRVYLNNCRSVAFVEADYYFTQNTHSCTHKKSVHFYTYLLFNKIKLKEYFDFRYGKGCALSVYYQDEVVKEYENILFSFVCYCLKNKVKVSKDVRSMLGKAYSIYRNKNIHHKYFKVQYYRLLWAILRKRC